MAKGDLVNLVPGVIPEGYHCRCEWCAKYIGELRPADGSYYSRLERKQYYANEVESGAKKHSHIAKTPLHIARWAVQQYSRPGDWVLDPTIGAGTTAVECLTQERSAAGMEIEYGHILTANIQKHIHDGVRAEVAEGDARNIRELLDELDQEFALVVNNPPYSGDVSMPSPAKEGRGKEFRALETRFDYDKTLPNLAFLKEGDEYKQTIATIYGACIERLAPGGHFVVGVKDMMRNKQPFLLHQLYNEILADLGLGFVGTALLLHYPGTLFLNSYEKMYGVAPPKYQTISVFRRPL